MTYIIVEWDHNADLYPSYRMSEPTNEDSREWPDSWSDSYQDAKVFVDESAAILHVKTHSDIFSFPYVVSVENLKAMREDWPHSHSDLKKAIVDQGTRVDI